MNNNKIEKEITEILSSYKDNSRENLIPILQDVQERFGYIPREAISHIGSFMKLPSSKIYGVATFYNQFKFCAPGRFHIMICRGTACHIKGSAAVLEAFEKELKISSGQTTRDGLFSLEVVACIGACGLAPVISINGNIHSKVSPKDVPTLIKKYRDEAAKKDGENEIGFKQ